jgi:uncharacterized RDD family membrane protein YckC
MKMDEHARAWTHEIVAQVLQSTALPPEQRSSLHWEILSHLHEAAERRAEARGGTTVTLADVQAVVAEMGARAGLAAVFLQPRVAATPRAGWAKRLGGLVIDAVIVLTALAVLNGVFISFYEFFFYLPGGRLGDLVANVQLLSSVALAFAYFAGMEYRFGATIGKMAFKLKVVRVDGSGLTSNAAVIRNVAKVVPPLFAVDVLLYFLAFHRDDQRASDRLANTVVIDTAQAAWTAPLPSPVAPRADPPRETLTEESR